MGKISDIWVRLGLKKEGFDKGMNDATKKAEGFGGSLNKIKAGAVAVWAAIGASVVAFGKKMIETTNAVGDRWALFTAQAKAGWNTFVQSLSAMNWDNFIGRFREAVSAAKELQSALDAEFEISNSIKLQKAAMAEELNALEILARNASKPYEERAAAAQKYLDMVRPIYEQEQALANKMLDAQQGAWLGGSGLVDTKQTRDDLTKFLVDYGKMNNGLADATSQLMNLQKERDVTYKTMLKSGNFAALQSTLKQQDAQIASLNAFLDTFASQNGYQTSIAKLAQVYETLRGDADTQPLVDALIRAGEVAGAFDRETKRMQSSLNASLSQIGNDLGGIKVPSIADVLEEAARQMDEVTDSDIADSVKHLEDVVNDIEITDPQVIVPKVKIGDVDAPAITMGEVESPVIDTANLRKGMDIVEEMIEDFKLPDINIDTSSVVPSIENAMEEVARQINGVADTDIADAVKHMEDVISDIDITAPSVKMPKVDAPEVEMPKIEVPKIEVPNIEVPKLEAPKIEAPKIEAPKIEVPKIEVPKIEVPEVEKIDMGEIEAPTINTDGLQSSIEKVNELLAYYKERTSEGLEIEPSEAQVISFAEFKLPDINTTDLAAGLYEVESIIAQYEAILNSVDGEINPTIDTAGLEEALAKAMQVADEYRRQMQMVEEMNYMLEDAIVGSMANGMQALMDLAAGVEGVDMKSALAAFIAPLGDTMKQMGAMIMAEGLAMEAFKKSFSNPYAAIAAGAALMAVGSAVSAGLQRLTANPTGGTAASYNGAGSYGSAEVANYEHTLNIEVTGKISGSDIVISGNKTNNQWNR